MTEKQAIQAIEALEKKDRSWARLLSNWRIRKCRIVYIGKKRSLVNI